MPLLHTTLLLASVLLAGSTEDVSHTLPSVVRWNVPIPARPAAPPTIDADHVFAVFQSGVVAAYRLADGVEAWHTSLRSDQSVAVEGARVFVAAGEAIHALNAATGAEIWLAPAGTATAPLLAQNGWLIAVSENGLTAFRADDGTKVWSRNTGVQHRRPTIEGDNLYVPLDDGHVLALDLATGAERWTRHFESAASEILAFPDRLFFGVDRTFHCLNALDGSREWPRPHGAPLRGRPAADDVRVFVAGIDNVVRAFDRRSGAMLWHANVPYRPSGPVVLGSAVVVSGNASEMRAFDAATGKPAGQIKLDDVGKLVTAPAFGSAGGAVVMAALTGGLNEQWKLVLTGPPPVAPPSVPHE